jgi:hypothetical protein
MKKLSAALLWRTLSQQPPASQQEAPPATPLHFGQRDSDSSRPHSAKQSVIVVSSPHPDLDLPLTSRGPLVDR